MSAIGLRRRPVPIPWTVLAALCCTLGALVGAAGVLVVGPAAALAPVVAAALVFIALQPRMSAYVPKPDDPAIFWFNGERDDIALRLDHRGRSVGRVPNRGERLG